MNMNKQDFKTLSMFAGNKGLEVVRAFSGRKVLNDSSLDALMLANMMAVASPAFGRAAGKMGTNEFNEFVKIQHWQSRWAQCGFPVFNLTSGLTAALILTECRGMTMGDLKFPFPSFLIQLPLQDCPFSVFDQKVGRREPARLISVHSWRTVDGRLPNDEYLKPMMSALRESIKCESSQRYSAAVEQLRKSAEALGHFRPCSQVRTICEDGLNVDHEDPYSADTPLERWLEAREPTNEESIREYGRPHATPMIPLDDGDRQVLRAAQRLVANLCLYLDNLSTAGKMPELAPRRPTKVGDDRLRPTTWSVGHEVKLGRQLRDAAKAFAEHGNDKARWRVQARFVVRGHWRNQAHGAGRLERRRIRIEPHWRGPEAGLAMARVYDAATTEQGR